MTKTQKLITASKRSSEADEIKNVKNYIPGITLDQVNDRGIIITLKILAHEQADLLRENINDRIYQLAFGQRAYMVLFGYRSSIKQ